MTPGLCVTDLFGCIALFQLSQRVAQRGERDLASILQHNLAYFCDPQGARRRGLQDFLDPL